METPTYTLLPVRNVVVFPTVPTMITVGRPRSVAALKQAQAQSGMIVILAQRNATQGEPEEKDLFRMGTLSRIESVTGSDAQGYHVVLRGVSRFRVGEILKSESFWTVRGETVADRQEVDDTRLKALANTLKGTASEILELLPGDTAVFSDLLSKVEDTTQLTHFCSASVEMPVEKKQELLEEVRLGHRIESLLFHMKNQKDSLLIQKEVRDKMSTRLSKEQKNALLREQLRTIKEQLGEGDEQSPIQDLKQKIEAANMPAEVLKVAQDELKRMEQINQASPEYHIIRTYLEWLTQMPWKNDSIAASSEGLKIDLNEARKILDADHYGLKKIKDRVVQHLAVMKLKNNLKGPILCFVGPPGVGKTSLGQSIARALGRKFVRASLGGVRDEAEIRGHRRTYIGAMPGRLIQGIKRAGTSNPVFMLDEIDKLSMSFQGDPAAALLEVLDPEQNKNFVDHYLDVPYDLSDVFFVATANTLETIPGPLRDRMEIIHLGGYTPSEKLQIAKKYLIPKQLEEHGIQEVGQFEIHDEELEYIVQAYTREAGIRDLQRKVATLARAAATQIVEKREADPSAPPLTVQVHRTWIQEALGPEIFETESTPKCHPPGVATGLAWTPVGGDILFIEAAKMPGKGHITITGQLGDVMKESAQIALSQVRALLPSAGFEFDFEKTDLHIHVPSGAIPKDGPSAGVALLTALASLLSNKKVESTLAMTGEITLRGAVTPVGGIKEKVIAAHRSGIKRILIPKRNQKDLLDVPDEVKRDLSIEFVESTWEVLRLALGLEVSPVPNRTPDSQREIYHHA